MDDNKVKFVVFFANGGKLDIQYFSNLFIVRGLSFDKESQDMFNMYAFQNIWEHLRKSEQPLPREQQVVPNSSPVLTENEKCPDCGVAIEKIAKYCHECGAKLEGSTTTQIQTKGILWHEALYKGLCNLIYSPPGGFKSMLSKYIGTLPIFNKCLYIIVDSSNSIDLSRYSMTLGEKAIIISQKMFQQKAEGLENAQRWQIHLESIMVYNLPANQYRDLNRMEEILNKIKRKYSSKDQVPKVDEVTVLCEIISEAIQMGIDFICVDSLNALMGDTRKLNRKTIQRILQLAKENGVTLLCIHHTNKSGIIAGSSSIVEEFDYVGRLSNDTTVTSLARNERILLLTEEKARYSIPQAYHIKAVFGDGPNPTFELVSKEDYSKDNYQSNDLNLTDIIINILNAVEGKIITLKKLSDLVRQKRPETVDGSIINVLTALSRKGIVQKTNDEWATITILSN